MASRRVKILYHDNCFDGAASASLFARFYEARVDGSAALTFQPKHHCQGDAYEDADFDADVHAVVDFRFTARPALDWWFDHHVSAFQLPGDEERFRASPGAHHHYDPAARSCSKFLATTAASQYGWDWAAHAELVAWADVIDGAQFESARTAVELAAPALQLMTWVEANHDPELKPRFIEDLTRTSLDELARAPYVASALGPLLDRHREAIAVIKAAAHLVDEVVSFDVADDGLSTHNKFIPYDLHPSCVYVVGVTASESRAKVSVGYNPWSGRRRGVSIAELCARYGGGGHPVVGAVSFPRAELERARAIAAEIADELRRSVRETSA